MDTVEPGQMTSESLSLLRPTSIVVDAPPKRAADEDAVTASDEPSTPPTKHKMPSFSMPKIQPGALKGAGAALQGKLTVSRGGGRSRSGATLVGLDIQPGYISAVQARVNGSILVQRAAGVALPPDTVREGEVIDGHALTVALKEMFHDSRLDKRVRVGVANQRTVLRTLELPPIADGKELATAVRFQAEDQIPMPLENAVLDYHPLGVIDTPAGPRMRVIVVAAQRDMVERLMEAVRDAGLRPEGVDLSAFALIRSLHRLGEDEDGGRVLYLNVGGLTNMAIAEGAVCRFTRVAGGGLESMAVEVAERHGIPLVKARELLSLVDLRAPAAKTVGQDGLASQGGMPLDGVLAPADGSREPVTAQVEQPSIDVRPVLVAGVREIAGEVRNSLDFHRSQGEGGDVSRVVLSGPALQIAGFVDALQGELAVPVVSQTIGLVDGASMGSVSAERLAIAAGLAVEEIAR